MVFPAISLNATTYYWTFGDTTSSTLPSPTHTYTTAGTYNITLLVTNPNTCNKADSVTGVVEVKTLPTANFMFDPVIPVLNSPTTFTNLSQNAVNYVWTFGDGTGSTLVNPVHMYKRTGPYDVCLEAISKDGCRDTICKRVAADVYPVTGVPTGFSPNGDGVNDFLFVNGAAVESLDFKVYNRWGELVFETKDMSVGWDGKYKGVEQEMEAYAWTLDVVYIDETTDHKQGNVTLIR